MSDPKITRFEPMGPADSGLQEWDPIDPADLEAGTPVQRGHIYHEIEQDGYLTGVWDCTAMTMKPGPYPDNELMLLLEGSLTLVMADGTEVTIGAGEPFVIPKGMPCQWKQETYLRKFFMIFGDPGGALPEDTSALSLILPQPAGSLEAVAIADPSAFLGEAPTRHNHTYFEDATGQMIVGVWDSTPFESAATPFPRNELMHLLEGEVTLTDGEGRAHEFRAGDTFYVPQGAHLGWKSSGYVRKIYAIYQPNV